MLDFSEKSNHIRAAATLLDIVKDVLFAMTVASSVNRRMLFEECKEPINDLLALNEMHFGASPAVRGNIALLAKACVTLRNLGNGEIHEDRSDGEGACPYCSTPITKIPVTRRQVKVYCGNCSNLWSVAMDRLSGSYSGFGTELI